MTTETVVPQGPVITLGGAGSFQLESVTPLANGGFYMAWDLSPSNGDAYQLFGQDFTAAGAPIGSPYDLNNGPSGNDQYGRPITGFANPSAAALADGNIALSYFWLYNDNPASPRATDFVLLASSGTPYFSETVNNPGGYNFVAPLGNSNSLFLYLDQANLTQVQDITASGSTVAAASRGFNFASSAWTASIGSNGAFLVGSGTALDYFDGLAYALALTTAFNVTGAAQLAGGEILLVEKNGAQGTSIYTQVFDPATDTLGAAQLLNASMNPGANPSIVATADGGYIVDWGMGQYATGFYVASSGDVSAPFTTLSVLRQSVSGQLYATSVVNGQVEVQFYTLQPGSVGTEALVQEQPYQPKYWSGAWTSAAVLSNGDLTFVQVQTNSYGQQVATEWTYDANNNETGSYTLPWSWSNYGAPHLTALALGGFYEVTYAGSTNYEIYNANEQQVFVHNQWSSPTGVFTALANGGFITTDSNSNAFGLFDAHDNNLGWISLPSNGTGLPTIGALDGGGFVFTYANSSAFDVYDASGNLLTAGDFGASASNMATGFGALSNGGFAEVWLSPDKGQQGLPTTIELQAFDASGAALGAPLQVSQDLDPWHTAFKIQAHTDGSATLLWSQGGGVFAAEYANGAIGSPSQALAGDLSTTLVVELPNDQVGFAWFQNGDVHAEVFDPISGTGHSVDLGPTSSTDLSTLHALATAQGGLAVSWHQGSGVLGAVLDSAGVLGPNESLSGDLLGVNSAGQAVTVYGNSTSTPFVQTLSLNDGLFWMH